MPKLTITQLEKNYRDSVDTFQAYYDETKHNIMLVAGNHYSKINSKIYSKLRKNYTIPDNVKLKITKNHLNKVIKKKINSVIQYSPGTTILPKDTRNIHDVKQAKLSRSVWEDYIYRSNYKMKQRKSVENFFTLGECWVRLLFDPSAGEIIGYEPMLDENGQPMVDMQGQPAIDESKPVFRGDFITDLIPAYDVFIDKGSRSIEESPYIGIKKMVQKDELTSMIENDPNFTEEEKSEKILYINTAAQDVYSIFDPINATVGYEEDKVLTKEYYYKPCINYPMGYFYITTSAGILWEGELQVDEKGVPIFPICYALCDEFEGNPRGYSPIKQLRPVQAEINRASSKIAETQITLGDDKIISLTGSGLTEGEKLNGIRHIKVSNAMDYKVVEGRSGEQYLAYLNSQITEFYRIADEREDEEVDGSQDITLKLYQSLKDKKKYLYYSDKIEMFLTEWTKKVISLAKSYYRDDTIIRAIGSSEAINIEEFKNVNDFSYDIKVVPLSTDVESVMGKYLSLTNVMQYGKLDERTTGLLIKDMPFIDGDRIAAHLTLAHTEAENIILALDRGEMPVVSMFDNNEVIVQELVRRMRLDDFDYIKAKNPEIEQNYMLQYEARVGKLNQKMEELKQANMGVIPTGGPQIKVDAYVPDPGNPDKAVRATVDQTSFDWFLQRLGEQGAKMSVMKDATVQTQIDMLGGTQAGNAGQGGNPNQLRLVGDI